MHGIGGSSLGFAVLDLALKKTGDDYQLTLDSREVESGRFAFMLEIGQIDVMDGGFSTINAEKFEQIYLPLEMGLLGWRVFIVHKDTANRLKSVRTVEDLKSFTFGQGLGWSDVEILEHSGFSVVTAAKLRNLVYMVKAKRFDILPLGANEAYSLLELFGGNDDSLIVDDSITLIYPFGRFFSVRKDDVELKKAIEVGMEKALSDGSLLSLLKSHPFSREAFERANLNQRVQIRIDTPHLTDGFKSIDPKWWLLP